MYDSQWLTFIKTSQPISCVSWLKIDILLRHNPDNGDTAGLWNTDSYLTDMADSPGTMKDVTQ
jgi:hypothetical protein